ncbi:MAG: hypothetical protein ACEY3B_06625 [Wolbachia sp.]
MQVADTGFHPKGQCLYDVIPVLGFRNFIKYKSSRFMLKYNVLMIMKKLDSRLE